MFAKFLGNRKAGPPDRKVLEKLLFGRDARQRKRWYDACAATYLEGIDESNLVETLASAEDRAGSGDNLIKVCVIQFTAGGPDRLGYDHRPLTASQIAIASKVYETIAGLKSGELFTMATSTAAAHAIMAWYDKAYAIAVTISTHILEHLNPNFGEAYRIRAFSYIMLGELEKAREDLQQALTVSPFLEGAREPLDTLELALLKPANL